MQWLCWWRRGQ